MLVSLMSQRKLSWNYVAWLNFLIGVARVLCNCTLSIATFPFRICPRRKLDARAWKWKPWGQMVHSHTSHISVRPFYRIAMRLYRFDRISHHVKKITAPQCIWPYFFLFVSLQERNIFFYLSGILEIVFEKCFLHKFILMWFFSLVKILKSWRGIIFGW